MTVKEAGDLLMRIVTVGGAVVALWKWVATPLKTILRKIESIEDDVGDLQGDRLNVAYTHHTSKGWCPKDEKARLAEMHDRYTSKGRNHLVKNYVETIMSLQEHPPDPQRR